MEPIARGRYTKPVKWIRPIEPYIRPAWQTWSRLSRSLSIGVRGLVFDAEGRVLLVEHTYTPGWYLPGGGVERGETAEQAVVRELREEGGVEATSRPRLISVHDNRERFPGDHVLLFRIDAWRPCRPTAEAEILDRGWFAPDALPTETTPATRRRLAEALNAEPPHPMW